MIHSRFIFRSFRLGLVASILLGGIAMSLAAERRIEARLVWGTNDEKSPDPNHKPLEGDLAKRIRDLPLKWKNYFEVNRKNFTISDQQYTNVPMSKHCALEIKDKGANNVTVKMYGPNNKPLGRYDKPLPKGEVLIIGGDDKGSNAWLVTVRAISPDTRALDPKKEPAIAKPAK
jgi:hypothetical protein